MADFQFKKRFGQNFLTYFPSEMYPQLADSINSLCILEIGPGAGALTKPLLTFFSKKNIQLDYHCIDIDPEALNKLANEIAIFKYDTQNIQLTFHNRDILTVSLQEICTKDTQAVWIFGSLPYNISKKIINWAFENLSKLERETRIPLKFIIQKEVAENYVSNPPQGDFLSHVANLFAEKTNIIKTLPPGSFYPTPKVTSVILEVIPKRLTAEEFIRLDKCAEFIHCCYGYKRKKLRFALKKILDNLEWEKANKVFSEFLEKRPEEITTEEFKELYDSLQN